MGMLTGLEDLMVMTSLVQRDCIKSVMSVE